MDPKAIDKAKSRFRVARKALDELIACDSKSVFVDTWYTYLVASKSIYTAIEQGSKQSAASRQWFGARKQERRDNELLQYFFQARDDDEHGIAVPIGYQSPEFEFGDNDGGSTFEISEEDDLGSKIRLHVKSKDGMGLVQVKARIPRMALKSVTARGAIVYNPPKTHFGKDVDGVLPQVAATYNLDYLDWLIREAEALS